MWTLQSYVEQGHSRTLDLGTGPIAYPCWVFMFFCKSLSWNLGLLQDPQKYLRRSQVIWIKGALRTPGGF